MKKPTHNLRPLQKRAPAIDKPALFDQLCAQVQSLATRIDALRAQGAANTSEFRQLERMLMEVQDRLMLAQARLQG
ncbi:MAG TPA: hypothetical protein V6D47_19855 [Oscillatoriaceae cyanobacterium]